MSEEPSTAGPGRAAPPEPWSHNLHYHRVIFDAIPRAASGPSTSAAAPARSPAASSAGCRIQLARAQGGPARAYRPPVVWPPPLTYRDTRRLATDVLPGVRHRHH